MSARSSAADRLTNPDAVLTRSDLAELGYERRAVDAVFKAVPNVLIPGYTRPLILVEDYLSHLRGWTYRDDRVYPSQRDDRVRAS